MDWAAYLSLVPFKRVLAGVTRAGENKERSEEKEKKKERPADKKRTRERKGERERERAPGD